MNPCWFSPTRYTMVLTLNTPTHRRVGGLRSVPTPRSILRERDLAPCPMQSHHLGIAWPLAGHLHARGRRKTKNINQSLAQAFQVCNSLLAALPTTALRTISPPQRHSCQPNSSFLPFCSILQFNSYLWSSAPCS